jgi:hypothetical protein
MARIGFLPSTVNDAAATFVVGQILDYQGNLYRYVQFVDAVAYAAGHVVCWANTTRTAVTNDFAGGSRVGSRAAGIALGVMTQNYYGFILVQGYYATVYGDGSVAAGDRVVAEIAGPTDGTADTMAAGEEAEVFGEALEADTGAPATFKCDVFCL